MIQIIGTKNRLEKQMDSLDVEDKHYDRKVLDLQRCYDEQYDRIEEIELRIDELKNQIQSIRQEKISGDNIYQLLLMFDKVYYSCSEVEQKEFMKAFIEKVELYPEKREEKAGVNHKINHTADIQVSTQCLYALNIEYGLDILKGGQTNLRGLLMTEVCKEIITRSSTYAENIAFRR